MTNYDFFRKSARQCLVLNDATIESDELKFNFWACPFYLILGRLYAIIISLSRKVSWKGINLLSKSLQNN